MLKLLDEEALQELTEIFSDVLETAQLPLAWTTADQVPMYKKGDTRDPANYRAISLLSCVGKTFERILEQRLRVYLEYFGLLDLLQSGFLKGRGSEQHCLLFEMMLDRTGPGVPAVFIDIKKAFPSIRRSSLMAALWDLGIRGAMYHIIDAIYVANRSCILIGDVRSVPYEAQTGVREGAILSPIIFLIFINQLFVLLREAGKGPRINGEWAGTLGYADDMAVLGMSLEEDPKGHHLQHQLDVIGNFARSHMIEFGYDKTMVVFFRLMKKFEGHLPAFTLQGMHGQREEGKAQDSAVIQRRMMAKYLGLLFSASRTWDAHHELVMQGSRYRASCLITAVLRSDRLPPLVTMQVIRTYMVPKLVYGAVVWAPSIFLDLQKTGTR